MWAALSPLVLWLAAIAAYAYEDGMNLFHWMGRFSQVLERPFSIDWTPYTLKCMLVGLLLYGYLLMVRIRQEERSMRHLLS